MPKTCVVGIIRKGQTDRNKWSSWPCGRNVGKGQHGMKVGLIDKRSMS